MLSESLKVFSTSAISSQCTSSLLSKNKIIKWKNNRAAFLTCSLKKTSRVERQGWHAMTLPPDIFRQLNTDFSDIRIFHIKRSDTLEVPYVLDVQGNVETTDIVSLPVLNKSYGDDALYLMFELNPSQQVNHLQLDFAERNYFGRVTLQGSDNRHQWFDIISDQRIVSVHKAQGDDYTLSRIDFPLTNYRFLRVRVEADVPLTFQGVSFHHNQVRKGNFRNMPLTWQDAKGNHDNRFENRTHIGHIVGKKFE